MDSTGDGSQAAVLRRRHAKSAPIGTAEGLMVVEPAPAGDDADLVLRVAQQVARAGQAQADVILSRGLTQQALEKPAQAPRSNARAGGDLLAFDNRRVLNGRRGYDAHGGKRFIEGIYGDRDDLHSSIRTLQRGATTANGQT